MYKFRLYYDKDKEIKWLNEMAEEGYDFKSFFAGVYHFERCEPGEYVYQVDMCPDGVDKEYRDIIADMGGEIAQRWGAWVILRRKASLGKFDLYTDVDSSIEHYKKIRRMFKAVAVVELLLFIAQTAMNEMSVFGYVCMGIILVILLSILRAVVRTNEVIDKLMERKTGIPVDRKRNISPVLAAGVLLNTCAIIAKGLDLSDMMIRVLGCIQIFAVILLAVGLVQIGRRNHK